MQQRLVLHQLKHTGPLGREPQQTPDSADER